MPDDLLSARLTGQIQTPWSADIKALIEELSFANEDNPKPVLSGSLTVEGHDYWVVLEYGSSPRTSNAGPSASDDVILTLPPDIPAPAHHAGWYPIRARHAKKLSFIDTYGRKRVETIVHHPGILSRGFIRAAVAKVDKSLQKELDRLTREDTLPDRADLVALINLHLQALYDLVRRATPIDTDTARRLYGKEPKEDGHLREAWGIEKAR